MNHEPVMLNEVLELIKNCRHQKILDGTLGLGGYSEAMLKNFPECFVLGLDRDQQAINFSRERLKNFELEKRFLACQKNFGSLSEIPDADSFDVYVFDLGVSNMQITTPERGFSFQSDGPLDMRMNPDENSLTAREVLEQSDEKTLAEIFWKYGEERFSRQIASAVKKNKNSLSDSGGSFFTRGALQKNFMSKNFFML